MTRNIDVECDEKHNLRLFEPFRRLTILSVCYVIPSHSILLHRSFLLCGSGIQHEFERRQNDKNNGVFKSYFGNGNCYFLHFRLLE